MKYTTTVVRMNELDTIKLDALIRVNRKKLRIDFNRPAFLKYILRQEWDKYVAESVEKNPEEFKEIFDKENTTE